MYIGETVVERHSYSCRNRFSSASLPLPTAVPLQVRTVSPGISSSAQLKSPAIASRSTVEFRRLSHSPSDIAFPLDPSTPEFIAVAYIPRLHRIQSLVISQPHLKTCRDHGGPRA